jgi:hypothetical protein
MDKQLYLLIKERNKINYQTTCNQNKLRLKELCELIKQTCQHNFVIDDIDITPDKSMRIKYCTICETTD